MQKRKKRKNFMAVNNNWLIIAIVFFSIIFYFSWIRYKEKKWINKHFDKERILALSFGVILFTIKMKNKNRSVCKSSGFLLLLPDKLFFKSRGGKIELEITKDSVKNIYHSASHKGLDLHQSVINIDYLIKDGKMDSAAFKVPYPPQWLAAIQSAFK